MSDDESIVSIAKKNRHILLLNKLKTGKLSRAEIIELEHYEEAQANKKIDTTILKTAKDIARELKVTVRTAQYWIKDGMPRMKDGTFDLESIKNWRESKSQTLGTHTTFKDKWEIELRQYKALKAKQEYLKEKGELLDRKTVMAEQAYQIEEVKKKFLGLGMQVAPVLVGLGVREIHARIDEAVKAIIKSFYEKR